MDAAFPEEVEQILAGEVNYDESNDESEGEELSDSDEDFLWRERSLLYY